jgi:hypothetical protein
VESVATAVNRLCGGTLTEVSKGEQLGGAWGIEPSSVVALDALTPAGCGLRVFAGELILAAPSTEKSPSEQAARAVERDRSCGQGRPWPARTGGDPARARRRRSCAPELSRVLYASPYRSRVRFIVSSLSHLRDPAAACLSGLALAASSTWLQACGRHREVRGECRGKRGVEEKERRG